MSEYIKGLGIWIGFIAGWIGAGWLLTTFAHHLPVVAVILLVVFFIGLVVGQIDDWDI